MFAKMNYLKENEKRFPLCTDHALHSWQCSTQEHGVGCPETWICVPRGMGQGMEVTQQNLSKCGRGIWPFPGGPMGYKEDQMRGGKEPGLAPSEVGFYL